MAWATASNVVTTNLDAGTDTPAAARPNLKAALDELIIVINGRAQASGVAPLNSSTKIDATYLPDELNTSSSTDLTLDPATGKVKIEEILNLAPQTKTQLNARTDKASGDVAYCSDGGEDSAGVGCVAVFDGTDWRAIQLGVVL
ncbi:MAG: hypothetical protein Unbinned3585contig1000_39 [Prokaryotic dsDNA virus sp.]|jgi:hypothetical protein|nr:MAG: hypothetical protein Unbinned3585contig1000_39 [Prokaryotic dsDNA virus sp.]|tara:strand:+ start:27987 stop:28418 length:432 start_codon:yes stop_codon:yes gene_type:complete